jgi:hypothetical protein
MVKKSRSSREQEWQLGEMDAAQRIGQIAEALRHRLRALLDWGFEVRETAGAVSVWLGPGQVVTAWCEADPPNSDSVVNHLAGRSSPGEFTPYNLETAKSDTLRVALEQLDAALRTLRDYPNEFGDAPMGWAQRF